MRALLLCQQEGEVNNKHYPSFMSSSDKQLTNPTYSLKAERKLLTSVNSHSAEGLINNQY